MNLHASKVHNVIPNLCHNMAEHVGNVDLINVVTNRQKTGAEAASWWSNLITDVVRIRDGSR